MRVYLAIFYGWESTYIVGVFSTRERAEAALDERREKFRNDNAHVEELEIDVADSMIP